jgi:protease-4
MGYYFSDSKSVGLIEVLSAEEAKTDNDIEGISILNNNSQLGMAQSKALRDALQGFKNQVNIMAYANSYSKKNIISIRLPIRYI